MDAPALPLPDGPVVIDGGLATELEARGHELSSDLWSAKLLAEDPAAIREVHAAFFDAGASVGISASYQASRSGFLRHGHDPDDADRLLRLSVQLVREARESVAESSDRGGLLVAASVGPFGATLHDGSEYRGRYGVPQRSLVDFHSQRLEVLIGAQPDLLAIETIPDAAEAEAIIEALDSLRPHPPAWLSFSCADGRTTNAGQSVRDAAQVVAGSSIAAVGANCTAPDHIGSLVGHMRAAAPTLAIVVYPNAGRVWDGDAAAWSGDGRDTLPDTAVTAWLSEGVKLIGGCCGLGPKAIGRLAAAAAARGATS